MGQAEVPGERWFSVHLQQAPLELYARATDSNAAAHQVLQYCFEHKGLGLTEHLPDFLDGTADISLLDDDKAQFWEAAMTPYMRPYDDEHHIDPILITDKRPATLPGVKTIHIADAKKPNPASARPRAAYPKAIRDLLEQN